MNMIAPHNVQDHYEVYRRPRITDTALVIRGGCVEARAVLTWLSLLATLLCVSPCAVFAHNHVEPPLEELQTLWASYQAFCEADEKYNNVGDPSGDTDTWCVLIESAAENRFGGGLRSFQSYLDYYPQGRYAAIARRTLRQIQERLAREAEQAASPAAPPSEAPAAAPPTPQQYEHVIERPPPSVAMADEQGCWETSGQCVALEHKWTTNLGLHLHFTNTCGERVYMQYCYEHCRYGFKDGICDTKGLGEQERWTVEIPADFHPTGPTWVQWLGSLDRFKDDECTAHSLGWAHNANPYQSGPGVTPPPCKAGE